VSLTVLPGADAELADRAPVTVYIGTARTQARIIHYGGGLAHLSFESPIACEGDVGYVIRGFSSNRERGAVLGGGRVLDANAPPLPKRKAKAGWSRRTDLLAAARDRDLTRLFAHLLAATAPRPLDSDDVERRFGLEPRTVRRTLESAKSIETTSLAEGRLWISSAAIASLMERLVDSVARHHRISPEEPGASLETLRAELRAVAGRDAAEHVVTRALESKRLQNAGQGLVCLPSFAESSRGTVERTTEDVSAALMKVALEGALDSDLVQVVGGNIAAVRAALTRLAAAGRARRLGTLWFAEDKLNELRSAVRVHLSEHGSMTVAAFKDIANVSRKQAIPLLEQFDREGTTRRVGDTRVLGGKAQP
jgi:selenocysteine-specific elongation factor